MAYRRYLVFSRYVVGVDGSSPSRTAAEWAVARARLDAVPVVLAHVEEPEGGMMGPDFARDELRTGARLLGELADALEHSGAVVSTRLLDGPVATALADLAEPTDLLVIGTHKTGFLHGRVLGSRSVRIAAAARASVAVIPDVDARFRHGVVVGIDDAPDAVSIALQAADEAAERGERLSMIRSLATGAPAHSLRESAAVAAVRAQFPQLELQMRESRRPAAEALLDASRDKALLVVGPGDADHAGLVIGTVLHDLLLNVNSPVLVARPAQAAVPA
jgi:nucleotide-binding universal stress UspA family protein